MEPLLIGGGPDRDAVVTVLAWKDPVSANSCAVKARASRCESVGRVHAERADRELSAPSDDLALTSIVIS